MHTCPECGHEFSPDESAADEAASAIDAVVCPECGATGLVDDFE